MGGKITFAVFPFQGWIRASRAIPARRVFSTVAAAGTLLDNLLAKKAGKEKEGDEVAALGKEIEEIKKEIEDIESKIEVAQDTVDECDV